MAATSFTTAYGREQAGALGIFVSIVNIFVSLLNIFSSR
jgi:FtsH-binding integral membrane protein